MKAGIAALALILAGCSNMAGHSDAYKAAHEAEFWRQYNSGGVDAMAVANLKAHLYAEKVAGR